MNIKISVVIVTYNSSNNIHKLLDSLINNKSYINEVIIIENNSPDKDKTQEVCIEYSKKINLIFVNSYNVGFGKSCNTGARRSDSSLILFLNPDTELQKNSLKILLSHMKKNKVNIIGGKAMNYNGKLHGSVVRSPNLFIALFEFSNLGKLLNIHTAHQQFYYEDKNILESDIDQDVDAVSGAYLLITKKDFSKLKGFDENIFMYLEDVDLCKRARDMGMKVVFCPHSIIWHIGGSSSTNKYKIRHQAWFDSRKYYIKKHFGFVANVLIRPLYIIEEFLLKKITNI